MLETRRQLQFIVITYNTVLIIIRTIKGVYKYKLDTFLFLVNIIISTYSIHDIYTFNTITKRSYFHVFKLYTLFSTWYSTSSMFQYSVSISLEILVAGLISISIFYLVPRLSIFGLNDQPPVLWFRYIRPLTSNIMVFSKLCKRLFFAVIEPSSLSLFYVLPTVY